MPIRNGILDNMQRYIVARLEDWDTVAKAIALKLAPGDVIALSGPLGAGKTTFVQALAHNLGAKGRPRSPSFSLVRTYACKGSHGIKRLVHVDAYRIESVAEIPALGLEDLAEEPGTVLAIEWPERLKGWVEHQTRPALRIHIDPDDQKGVRHVKIT